MDDETAHLVNKQLKRLKMSHRSGDEQDAVTEEEHDMDSFDAFSCALEFLTLYVTDRPRRGNKKSDAVLSEN